MKNVLNGDIMTDKYVFKSEYGSVTVNRSTLTHVVEDVLNDLNLGVKLASKKDIKPYGRNRNNIEIIFGEDMECSINLFVIINFGTSISKVTYNLISEIKNRMDMIFDDIKIHINIKIVGIKSKNIAKRNIEVSRSYDISE